MTKRAAHFLLVPELAHSPPNDALVSALLSLGYAVDLYAPGGRFDMNRYGPNVSTHSVEYGYKWLARNLLARRWFDYSLFSGTTEDPMAVVGLLARLYRRPCITMADEINSGSYAGNRSRRWKNLCRFGMRARGLTVVNETERIELQRDYAGLSVNHPVLVYPGCFAEPPPPWNRTKARQERAIPQDALVVCYSGTFNYGNGALWLANGLGSRGDVWFWGQILHTDPLVHGLLTNLRGGERLVVESSRLAWHEAWAAMAVADIGMVVYLQDAPQFQHMGTASNRLCMFLSMGVPVIASRQPSFAFIEEYDCGVLVDDFEGFSAAIDRIAARLPEMRENARRCACEYIRAPERYHLLRDRIGQLAPLMTAEANP